MPQKVAISVLILLLSACSAIEEPRKPHAPKEFSHGEIILGSELLTKIFDQQMAPIKCVPDINEASLLLRTIHPRMEVVQDDLEAVLDNKEKVKELINTCDQNCTCGYIDELFREHLVVLDKKLRATLNAKKTDKEVNRCLNYVQSTFCQSDLYKELEKEKVDFTFDEVAP